jgi:hypothetical protein
VCFADISETSEGILESKISELETKEKEFIELYRDINEFKTGFQPRVYL